MGIDMRNFILFVTGSFSQLITQGGKCPEVPLIADFSLSKYAGDWHSQTRYMASFDDPNERCSLASYSPLDEITIFVNNSGIKPKEIDGEILQKSEWLDGTAFQTNVCCKKFTIHVVIINLSQRNSLTNFLL